MFAGVGSRVKNIICRYLSRYPLIAACRASVAGAKLLLRLLKMVVIICHLSPFLTDKWPCHSSLIIYFLLIIIDYIQEVQQYNRNIVKALVCYFPSSRR